MKLQIQEEWQEDIYGCPQKLTSDGSYQIVEIDINERETQVFILKDESLYVRNLIWGQEISSLMNQAMEYISRNNIKVRKLKKKVIGVGVWHFGHTLGDFPQILGEGHKYKRGYELHQSVYHKWMRDWFGCERMEKTESIDPVRIYELEDCCLVGQTNAPKKTLRYLHKHYINNIRREYKAEGEGKSLLLSGRSDRISNTEELIYMKQREGWRILNPQELSVEEILNKIERSGRLVCENGSILFNCFAARSKKYSVFCSDRMKEGIDAKAYEGGGKYNEFHKRIISYIYSKCEESRHHPYSDKIEVNISNI